MQIGKNMNVKVDDEKSIEKLCEATWEPLYRYIYFKVQNWEEAEDVTQETYIKAISYIKKNDVRIDNIMSFLRSVALNVIRDRWRKNKRQGIVVNFDDINPEETSVEDHTELVAQREVIQESLMLLSEEQRIVIELRILKGYSTADTAMKMDKTESNVRVLQYRALQNLNKILKDKY